MVSARHSDRLPWRRRRRVALLPTTRLGSWGAGLAFAGFVLLNFAWTLLGRLGGFPGLILALAGGVAVLVAILRRGERGLLAFASLLPFLSVVAFVLAELLIGHD